jgi:plastocyanin
MRGVRLLVLLATAGVLVLAWPAHAADRGVAIRSNAFDPSALTVNVGDKVIWTNSSTGVHNVTDGGGEFQSGSLAPGQTFPHTFTAAKSYTYSCTIHGFSATLKVQAAPATTAPPAATTRPPATTAAPTTTSTTAKSTTTTSSTTTIPDAVVTTSSTTSTTLAGPATAPVPKHDDSAVGPLLAAIAVVLAAGAATAVYLIRQRRSR